MDQGLSVGFADPSATRRCGGTGRALELAASNLGCKLPQALVASNCVVVKPSASSALVRSITLWKIARFLPPGVVNILRGPASRIGDPLIGHPLVRWVNFTGTVDIGRHGIRFAAEHITPVTLELGGNDVGLILQDLKMDDAGCRV